MKAVQNARKNALALVCFLTMALGAMAHTGNGRIAGMADVLGFWSYTVDNAPPEYQKGVLMIDKVDGKYTVEVHMSYGDRVLSGTDIKADADTIHFNVVLEGTVVSVSLKVEGDTLSGETRTSEGSYPIKAERLKAPE